MDQVLDATQLARAEFWRTGSVGLRPRLSEAGLGVAFPAEPTVAAKAHARVDRADLTAPLNAQGIPGAEFISD